MNKCRVCQQISNNLTKVYSNKIKSLAQIILKLKGFKDSLDVNKIFEICGNCKQGIENVAILWENIPEAKPILEELDDEKADGLSNAELYSVSKQSLPAITSTGQEQHDYEVASTTAEAVKLEPIKITIKLPRKRKRPDKITATTSLATESLPKRIRRCPKRYEDFDIASNDNKIASDENSKTESNKCGETSLNNSLLVALLRLNDGQDIGKLVEVDSKGVSCRIRIICGICCQVFCFEKTFQKHFKTHNKNQCEGSDGIMKNYLYYCKLCDKSFGGHYAVRRHFSGAHSEERPLKCQYCEANFKYHFNLNYHMAKHVPKEHFECVFCKKKFLKRYELKIHLRTHTKERPYKCKLCSFASAHLSNLKTHEKIKHLNNSKISMEFKGYVNIEETTIPVTVFTPPLALLEDETEMQPDLNDEHVSDLTFIPRYVEDFSNDLRNENVEINFSETENSLENIPVSVAKVTCTNDNNNFEVSESTEACRENLISQAMFGNFKLDCSILKALPSSTLLDLKKWPKSFQSIPTSCTQDLADPIKSIIKYKPLEKYSSENSTEIDNYSTTYNVSCTPQSAASCNYSNSNGEATSLEGSSACILKEGSEFINISQTSLIKQHQEHLNDDIQSQIVDNKLRSTEIDSHMPFDNVSLEINESQSWKVLRFSAKPVKTKNISYIKTTSKNSTTSNDAAASYESNTLSKISNEAVTAKSLTFLETNIQQIETPNCLKNIQMPNSSSKPLSKYNNTSQQSLLKPDLKTQQIANLSLTNRNENAIILASTPLITKVEILPPLNMMDILKKASTTTGPSNLIKPPIEYKHQCTYCYKYFKQKSNLSRHIRTHTGDKPYKCNLCLKSYADASNYKKHKTLHKNAAEALNISGKSPYAVQSSPAYSNVSDPDPDGVEVMQTLKRFECSSTEDDEDIDDTSTTSSTMESQMWQNALEHALNNDGWRENLKRNLTAINNAILPKSMEQSLNTTDLNKSFSIANLD